MGKGEGVSMVKGGKRVEERGMGMINIDSLIKVKQFKNMHKILNSKNDNWNSIDKWWLTILKHFVNVMKCIKTHESSPKSFK